MVRTVFNDAIPEGATRFIQAYIYDKDDNALPVGDFDSFKLTLYNCDEERTILNTRGDTDVLNANGGTLDSSGLFILELNPQDNMIINSALTYETHRALLTWTYHTNKIGRHEVEFQVKNMSRIPTDENVWR